MSIIRADSIKNRGGNGAPDFPKGLTVTGVVTATTLNQNTSGDLNVGSNIKFGNASGIVTATTFVGALTGNASGTAGGLTGTPAITVGNIIAADGTFSGNVSIAKTLTYEDVTNIDSVGVVTAREGIRVGSGKSIGADVGTVTYYGSGIGVTSLNAGKLSTGTVPTARLGTGTANNTTFLRGDNSWQVVSSGTYSPHAFDEYSYHSGSTHTGRSNYYDISGGNTVSFTPTSTNDIIFFNYGVTMYQGGADRGAEVYLMMKAGDDAIGSGNTKLDYFGQHTKYINQATAWHDVLHKSLWYPCSSLNVGTAYYVEVAGAIHNSQVSFNHSNTGDSGYKRHFLQMMHYKKN